MENGKLIAQMSSKGPWYNASVKANCILSRRCVRSGDYSLKDIQGQIAKHMESSLGKYGLPSERTVREWEKKTSDFPNRALTDGVIGLQDIAPPLRRYLIKGR